MIALQDWLIKAQYAGITDIPYLLNSAPAAIQQFRGAWENEDFSLLIRAVAAISFLEGVMAAHPSLPLEEI